MKIFVINGENDGSEKFAFETEGLTFVSEIRMGLPAEYGKHYYRLIHNNIMLNNNDPISRYHFCDNNEIWCGKLETFIKGHDKVIVEVFLAGWAPYICWLLLDRNQPIAAVKAILASIEPAVMTIFTGRGQLVGDDQMLTDIAADGYYRLIVSYGDADKRNVPYDECDKLYNLHKIRFRFSRSHLLYYAQFSADGLADMTRCQLIYQMMLIREIIASNQSLDGRLNENLSNFQFLIKSKFLFQQDISARIFEVSLEYWMLMKPFYDSNVWAVVALYFRLSLLDVLSEYSDAECDHGPSANRSFGGIIIDVLDRFILFLSESGELLKSSAKIWSYLFSFITLSGSEFDDLIDDDYSMESFCTVKSAGNNHQMVILSNPRTVSQAKAAVAIGNEINEQDLYVIDRQNHQEPVGQDRFCQGNIMEMMRSMENFEFLNEIGKGAFGTIDLHREKISGNRFVIKKLIDVKCSLYRDAFIGAKLSQSDLLRYSEIVKGHDSIYLAMPYMPGGSLSSYIQQGGCQHEKDIVKISYQILSQINELHRLEIIHRDIKPENIVFDGEGNPKLIDFGLARYTARLTKEDLSDKLKAYFPGTLIYMAPELVKAEPYSSNIDIWSFGMVLVEMVTGKPPFHRVAIGRIAIDLKRMKKYNFKSIIPISEGLHQFISLCLTVDPDQRPSSQQLIESELIIDYLHKCSTSDPVQM